MDDSGPSLPLGPGPDGPRAVPMTNADGNHAVLVRDGDLPKVLVTIGTDARAGRVLVTPLDKSVEIRRDREAAAQWIAGGSVTSPRTQAAVPAARPAERTPARVPAWANVIGLALVLLIFGLTILGALTLAGWLAGLVSG